MSLCDYLYDPEHIAAALREGMTLTADEPYAGCKYCTVQAESTSLCL